MGSQLRSTELTCVSDFLSASLTMGVIRPLSVATAMAMSTPVPGLAAALCASQLALQGSCQATSHVCSAELTCVSDFLSASLTMGVIKPLSVATAMAMSTPVPGLAAALCASQLALAAGTSAKARATARTMKSFKDTCRAERLSDTSELDRASRSWRLS